MTALAPARVRPGFSDLVSIAERMEYLRLLRIGFASVVLLVCVLATVRKTFPPSLKKAYRRTAPPKPVYFAIGVK